MATSTFACAKCARALSCEWSPDWYYSPMTAISLGKNELARRFGKFFVAGNAAFLLAALCQAVFHRRFGDEPIIVLFMCVFLVTSVFEIWAYLHGRPTHGGLGRLEATPKYTDSRTVALLVHAFMWLISIQVIRPW